MSSLDLITMGIKSLLRRKARTILTVLGVVVGTASIVVMLSLGLGMSKGFEEQLQQFGSLNTISVSSKGDYYFEEEEDLSNGKVGVLDDAGVLEIEGIEGVQSVLPMQREWMEIYAGKYASDISLIGIDFSKLDEFDFEVEEGVLPTKDGKYEILFGSSIKDQFYNPRSRNRYENQITVDLLNSKVMLVPIRDYSGNQSKPNGIRVKPTGILKMSNDEKDWNTYIDIKQLEDLKLEAKRKVKTKDKNNENNNKVSTKDKYSELKVKVSDVKKVPEIQKKIKEMGFQAYSLADGLEYMENATKGIRATLGGIGAVSLFVAALGITNTMVMSIYERTKEIGVMKVLGAELKDIRKLFLFEAGLIGLFGGLLGLLLSVIISKIINTVGLSITSFGYGGEGASTISYIPTWLSGLSIVFSTFVGIGAGMYPANRAMKLSALEAIRNE